VVSRSTAVWLGAALWFWHGDWAGCGVDLRVGACAGDDSICAHAKSHLSV